MERKKKPLRLTRREFLKGAALISAGGLLAACKPQVQPTATPTPVKPVPTATPTVEMPVSGGELFVGEVMDPLVYDPHLAGSEWVTNLTEKVCDKLVYLDPKDRSYRAGLAESWEVAPDGLSITFHLRKDVVFHDGTPFNAETVRYNLDRIVDPATKSMVAAMLIGPYDSTEVLDEYTAKVKYKAPYAPGLDAFSQGFFCIVSPAGVKKYGEDFAHNVIGSGPFMWSEYARDDHIGMVRNPNYKWGSPIFAHPGPAYLDKITYKLIPDHNTRAGMIRSGQLHILEGVPEAQVESFRKDRIGFIVYATPGSGFPGAALINTQRFPTDDVNVRRAINYGTNRAAIAKAVWFDVWPPASGPLTKASLGYNPKVESYYPYNPQKAQQLLDEAGWKVGSDGIRVKDGKRLEISLIYAAGTWLWTELFQAQMKEIGIEVKIMQLEPMASWQASAQGEANMSPNVQSGSDPSILSLFFHSRMIGMFNWTYYKDDKLDSLLDQGITEMDKAKRMEIYAQIQELIMDQALIIPLADSVLLFVLRPEVKGLVVDPRGLPMYLLDVWLKKA